MFINILSKSEVNFSNVVQPITGRGSVRIQELISQDSHLLPCMLRRVLRVWAEAFWQHKHRWTHGWSLWFYEHVYWHIQVKEANYPSCTESKLTNICANIQSTKIHLQPSPQLREDFTQSWSCRRRMFPTCESIVSSWWWRWGHIRASGNEEVEVKEHNALCNCILESQWNHKTVVEIHLTCRMKISYS